VQAGKRGRSISSKETRYERHHAIGDHRPRRRLPRGDGVITFLQVCLYAFAGCAALGILPAGVLAARTRNLGGIVLALLASAFVIFVLTSAAGDLR
jgi:hypothetical protein